MRAARCCKLVGLAVGSALVVVTAVCSAQESGNPSLGDLAREIQAERAQQKSHPVRIYTNDDFPPHSSSQTGAAQSRPESTDKSSETQTCPLALKSGATAGACATYYRGRMRQLSDKLAADQRSFQDAVAMVRWLGDPTGVYTGEETPADKNPYYRPYHLDEPYAYQELTATKAAIAADEDAITALEDQCRRDGCPPDWLR